MEGNQFSPDDEAVPLTAFPGPITPPPVDPDFRPVNVPISCYWIPYVVGAIKAMNQQKTWKFDTPSVLEITQDRVQELIDIFADAINSTTCDDLFPPLACGFDFTASDGAWTVIRTAAYLPFTGWVSVPAVSGPTQLNGLWIHWQPTTPATLIKMVVRMDVVPGNVDESGATQNNISVGFGGADLFVHNEPVSGVTLEIDKVVTLDFPPTTIDHADIFWYANYGSSLSLPSGVTIKEVAFTCLCDTDFCS